MEVSDGGLFANDVEMSAETFDICLPDNGGLIANDVEMSAEMPDQPLPCETEADGGLKEDQLDKLLKLSQREALNLQPITKKRNWRFLATCRSPEAQTFGSLRGNGTEFRQDCRPGEGDVDILSSVHSTSTDQAVLRNTIHYSPLLQTWLRFQAGRRREQISRLHFLDMGYGG